MRSCLLINGGLFRLSGNGGGTGECARFRRRPLRHERKFGPAYPSCANCGSMRTDVLLKGAVGNGQNGKGKIKRTASQYLRCPLALLRCWWPFNIGVYFINANAGLMVSAGLVLYLIIALIFYYTKRKTVFSELITFAAQYGQVQRQLIMDLALPYAVLDDEGKVLWFNQAFADLTGKENRKYRKSITNIFSEFTRESFPEEGQEADYHFSYMRKDFRAHIKNVNIDSMIENTDGLEAGEGQSAHLFALYLFDETQINEYIRKYEDETMVTGLIYLDNYDEALESVEDVRRSLLTALVDRRINKYFNDIDGLVKKYGKR